MSLGAPQTEDEIYEEVRSQLAKIMMTQEHTIYNIEAQSKEVSEYPIAQLARKAGFRDTRELLQEWFDDLIEFDGSTVRAYSSLYDTPELQHIISLAERTKMKTRRGGGRRGRGGGGRGGGRAGAQYRPSAPLHLRPPPQQFRRGPPPGQVPISQMRQPPQNGFTVRRNPSPDYRPRREPSPRGFTVRRELSPDREPRHEPLFYNRPPPHSERSVSSVRTAMGHRQPLPPPVMARGRSPPQFDFVERSESIMSGSNRAAAGPPPGFSDGPSSIEVSARGYEHIISPNAVRNYEYEDEDADPYAVNTARTFGDYVNVPNYQHNDYPEDRHQSRNRRSELYDEEYDGTFYVPPAPQSPRYNEGRPSLYYDEHDEYDYLNGYVENRNFLPHDYDRYDHHNVNGVIRERNINRTPDAEAFYDVAAEDDNRGEIYDDTPDNKMELQPSRIFIAAHMRNHENQIYNNDNDEISAAINRWIFVDDFQNPVTYSKNYLDYFIDVITDIHFDVIRSRNYPSFDFIIRSLPQKILLVPGFDSYSIYSVMRALGSGFFVFHDDVKSEPGVAILRIQDTHPEINVVDKYKTLIKSNLSFLMPVLDIPEMIDNKRLKACILESRNQQFPYFVKLNSTLKEEKELESLLRNTKVFDVVYPFPHALCIYYKEDKPYRAQILAELNPKKVSIELVDVGVFLSVRLSDLKRAESDVLSIHPRYAIPAKLDSFSPNKPVLEDAVDKFPRKSTNKTIPMILTPCEKFMSMTLY